VVVEMSVAVIDGHVDLIYELGKGGDESTFTSVDSGHVTAEKLKAGAIKIIVVALFSPDSFNGPQKAGQYFSGLIQIAENNLDGLKKILSSNDLTELMASDHETGVLFLVENADPLLEYDIEELVKRKIMVVGLTHVGENRLGDGNNVFHPQGLTKEGKELVRLLEENSFAIDVAHLSDPSFNDLMDIFKGSIISSHTGFRFFCSIPRNLEKYQLEAIFERNGIVGITVNPEMLTGEKEADIEEVFRHIDWVAEKYGPEYVALGSDYCGFTGICYGLEDISKLKNLAGMMERHGYPESAVELIMGGNWYRFYNSFLS